MDIIKTQEQRNDFIRLRAEGKSYDTIASELHIAKGTCVAWEKELKEEIAKLKQEQLNDLYNDYHMTREARAKQLGTTLNKIEEAINKADFNELHLDKLLDYKLKYTEALKEEYIAPTTRNIDTTKLDSKEVVTSLQDLLKRVRNGEVSQEQASKEMAVLTGLLKAYDTMELEDKLRALEGILDRRA